MAVIDIGALATDRSDFQSGLTMVSKENPANDTGTIDTVEIWAYSNLASCEVATFFVVSGDNLSTRDTEAIGAVTSGSKQTFSNLDMDVTTGDYIGTYSATGQYEDDATGTGIWYTVGDSIPCTNTAFTSIVDFTLSLYGTGTTAVTSAPTGGAGGAAELLLVGQI